MTYNFEFYQLAAESSGLKCWNQLTFSQNMVAFRHSQDCNHNPHNAREPFQLDCWLCGTLVLIKNII